MVLGQVDQGSKNPMGMTPMENDERGLSLRIVIT